MKRHRLILILSPILCVVLYAVFGVTARSDTQRSNSSGERLSIAGLAPNEEVVVSKLFAHRNVIAREYRFSREGESLKAVVFDQSVTWSSGKVQMKPTTLLAMRAITKKVAEELDETVAYFREAREEVGSAERHYRLVYFRDGGKIGEEFYVGFSLPDRLAYADREGFRDSSDYALEFERLSRQYQVSEERVRRMMPFEILETKQPNQQE